MNKTLFLICLLLSHGVALANPAEQARRPNIVFLFADDQRADAIGVHGNPHIQTPNLDRLAAQGFSFRRNYCAGSFSGAVCVASRAMLMTGRHWMNLPENRPASNWGDSTVLPALLTSSGKYNSFIVGKWHNGRGTLEKALSNGRSIYMGGMANHADFQVQDLVDGELGPKREAGGFSSTVFADEAVKFIQTAGSDQPFFLYVAFMAPHDPRNPPEEYRRLYYEKRPPLPANFLSQHPFRNAPQTTSGRDESLAPWPRSEEVISDQLCEYYGLVTHLDEQVGRVLKALNKSPHAENTLVIYTADHGLAMGSHGLLGKQNVYEQSMRCPLILSGPGVPKGKSSNALTYVHDLYSTICDFADVEKPDGIDSQSLAPIMNGRVSKVRDSLYLPFQDNQRAVRDGKWKLHVYPKINHRLLFDLATDPHELTNLAADPAHKADVERMQTLMDSWRKRLGDPYPLSVDNPDPKEPQYDNSKRVLDAWQPKWIRDKYFGGRDNPDHGRRSPRKKTKADRAAKPRTDYLWTTDHMHVGVRWQPFIGRPQNNAYDATRPVIATDSSYVQFWASWAAIEPTPANTDYQGNPSPALQEIERAVDVCNAEGLKVEFVFFHCPAWASESDKAGGFKPRKGLFEGYVKRIATHFKRRVHAYQLSHEANLQGLMQGADIEFVIDEILLKGAQTIRSVYEAEPSVHVLVSTTGMSPCEPCAALKGLDGKGARAVNHFYDLMIGHPQLMKTVDALNLNVSDHSSGYGNMDGSIIPSVWAQYDLVRRKLDAANYRSKAVLSSESWIVWDDAGNAHDINGDKLKNEKDAYRKAVTIIGQCLERGLNTINLPWSDNSSAWAMGLTKRRDYSGRIKSLKPEIVVPANDGGPDIVTRKLGLRGQDGNFTIADGGGNVFTVDNYMNPPDPNHLHYYIWKWYAQIAGGSDEVIRHAVAGEGGNDIAVTGEAYSGDERYRISSFNRMQRHFVVLLYASGANGKTSAKISIPSKIKTGYHYNNEFSRRDFRGEGFSNGDTYYARIITKDISSEDGADHDSVYLETDDAKVGDETLTVTIPNMSRFTTIEFVKRDSQRAARP